MEEVKYKPELNKREAEIIGEVRWSRKRRRRYLLLGLGALLVGLVALIGFEAAGVTDWVSMPVFGIFAILSYVILIRFFKLQTKAGKDFVKSLEEGQGGRS